MLQPSNFSARRFYVVAALGLCACSGGAAEPGVEPARAAASGAAPAPAAPVVEAREQVNPRLLRRFAPLAKEASINARPLADEKVALGRMLYFDKRLSKDQNQSCNTCHQLTAYGVDGRATSLGSDGKPGTRNAPTVYNAAAAFVQFWDGRAADVEAQAKGPIINPNEMAMPSPQAVVERLKGVPGYVEAFARAFSAESDPLTYDNVGRAIGAFERKLTTPARWDAYLAGEPSALTSAEVEGLKLFMNVGCMVCHTGELLGGTSYQRVGAVEPWPNQLDEGRYGLTQNAADKMMFKVPTLRNVAETGPYFHDGSVATLTDAVRAMGRYQVGIELSDPEVESIVSWLKALTGSLPYDYIKEPVLPESPSERGPT